MGVQCHPGQVIVDGSLIYKVHVYIRKVGSAANTNAKRACNHQVVERVPQVLASGIPNPKREFFVVEDCSGSYGTRAKREHSKPPLHISYMVQSRIHSTRVISQMLLWCLVYVTFVSNM